MTYAFDSRRASKLKAMFLAESGDMSTETTSLAPPSAAKTETIPQPAPTSRKFLPARAPFGLVSLRLKRGPDGEMGGIQMSATILLFLGSMIAIA